MDFLEGLNPQQRQAVAHASGPLLILAGAGSGKTRVITHRICHLIHHHQIHPASILAVTFTNKAAQEMRQRVSQLLGENDRARLPRLSTFHAFCVRLLRRDGDRLAPFRPGFNRSFNIYDEDDQLALVKQVFRNLGLDEKFMAYRAALSAISHGKNRKETPDDFYKRATDPKMSHLATVFEHYEAALRRSNALDFDDLLLESVRLLQRDADVRAQWNDRLRHLMVDEYQDTNRSQYELMRLLSVTHDNVCVVGDEDQSIYSWRGADIRNILDFEHDYPNATIVRLEQNYRSTRNILDAAGSVVAHNTERKGKNLWTEADTGSRIRVYEAWDGENEALYIADMIDRTARADPGRPIAVLYRTNFQSRQIEEALRRYGRKYVIAGGVSFYQRAEVKDILAHLKVAQNPDDSVSLLRIINTPARGIGKSTVEPIGKFALERETSMWRALGEMLDGGALGTRAHAALTVFRTMISELIAAASLPVDRLLNLIVERSGYKAMLEADGSPEAQGRLENLAELINAAAEAVERGEGAAEFLDHAALVSDADQVDEHAPIMLLTMHTAKGLEFPYVFLAGMEEGLFPHSRALRGESSLEEERRLCYVGMTRARKGLTLTWARQRRRFGGGEPERAIPSRFLDEVPARLIERAGAARHASQVNLYLESHEVRETARRTTYTGKTYNSLDNIAEFFRERGGVTLPKAAPAPAPKPAAATPRKAAKGVRPGGSVNHPRYGQGTILRQEGSGDDAKLTVSFPGYGLKKIIAKYAGLIQDE